MEPPTTRHGGFASASASTSAAWRRELLPWTDALRGKLSLSVDDVAPLYSDVLEHLWIQCEVPTVETEERTVETEERNSLVWLEALQLLDAFVTVDRRACWELIFDLCDGDARAKLRTLGCPLEFIVALRPRYELRYKQNATPSVTITAYLLEDRASPAFSCVWNRLRQTTRSDSTCHVSASPPIVLRLEFLFGRSEACSCLERVLELACRVASRRNVPPRRFEVASLAITLWRVSQQDEANELVSQIACHVPLHKATIQYAMNAPPGNLYGPNLWRMFAPYDEARASCGVRSLTLDTDLAYHFRVHRDAVSDQVVALFSTIASSKTLDELSLTCMRGSWRPLFALALFSPTAQHQIHTLRLSLGRNFRRFVGAIKRSVDQGNDTSTRPLIPWPPEVVRVGAQSKILGFELPDGDYDKTVYHGTQSVECLVRGQDDANVVRVVLPGIGVGCIDRKDVLSQTPARLRPMHSIRKLTLVVQCIRWAVYERNIRVLPFDTASVVELLRLIGEPLVDLTLTCVGDRSTKPFQLDDILVSCPHLQHLKLVKMTLSAEQIFATIHGHSLESLTLDDCEVVSSPHPPPSDVSIASTVFPRLTSLYVASTGHHIQDYVLAFARQRSLHRLVVKCRDETQREQYDAYMVRHDGAPIQAIPLREKLAFLSVGCSKPTLGMDIVALIFEMASTAMRRRVYHVTATP